MGHDHGGLSPLTPKAPETDEQVIEHPRAPHSIGLTPVTSPVHSQQAELADRLADCDEFDEDYDETAEPYEPEGGSAGFSGFDRYEDDDGDAPEPEFKVQFKGGKRPLDLGPGPDEVVQSFEPAEPVVEPEQEEDVLDLIEAVEPAEAPEPEFEPVVVALPEPRVEPAAAGKPKAAFTLRLDPQRHLKLRLACAVRGSSAQQLVTDALDRLLTSMPDLEDMADKVRQRN
ncbi:MAG: hypothetical protein ABIS39_02065 [Sphingomicrobium sp.]